MRQVHDQPSDDATPAIEPAITTAIARLLPGSTAWDSVGDRAFLAIGNWEGHDLRVRRWPRGTTPERVRFVHQFLRAVSASEPTLVGAPFAAIAGGETWLQLGEDLVDVQLWLPGKSLAGRVASHSDDGHTVHRPLPITPETHQAAVQSLAHIHQRTAKLAEDRHAPHARIPQVLRAIGQAWGDARVSLRPSAPVTPPIQRWLKLSEQVLPAAETTVKALAVPDNSLVVAHLALWPAHLIEHTGAPIRLVDSSSAVATTPLLDIAQMTTRFPGWTGDLAEQVLGHYADIRPLSPDERRALPAFAALDLVIEAGRLLRLGYAGGLPPTSRGAVAARAGALDMLNSIDALLSAVVRGSNPVPFVKQQKLAKIRREAGSAPVKNPNAPQTRKRRPKK